MFPHSQSARWWVSGQSNVVFQAHPEFDAAYSGTNSFHAYGEHATSNVETLYLGYQLGRGAEVLLDVESAGGRGLSDALGLAGFTNLDVVRNPDLGQAPYLARAEFHQTFRLSKENVAVERGPLALATSAPARRLEFRVGKFSTVDFFDVNGVGSDSHLQFLNWTVDGNGGYDYAADTRGYTYGLLPEYQSKRWAFRFGEMLMPTVANGIDLVWDLRQAHAENYELELRPTLLKGRKSVVRLLAYENQQTWATTRRQLRVTRRGWTRPKHRKYPASGNSEVRLRLQCGAGVAAAICGHSPGWAGTKGSTNRLLHRGEFNGCTGRGHGRRALETQAG